MRRYVEQRGVDLDGRSLRVVIPVNVRGNGDATELGNQISFVPVPLPLDLRDPLKLLAVVTERVEFLKRARAAEFVGLFGGLLATLPNAFWKNVGPVVSQLPLSLCNTICTNVPGPQVPLYLMGHKMLSWYPWVPIGGLMGINCAILTYNGTAFFGFTGDVHAAPDLERLEKFVDESFAELKAGVRMHRRRGRNQGHAAGAQTRAAEREDSGGRWRRVPIARKRTVRKKDAKKLEVAPGCTRCSFIHTGARARESAGGRSVTESSWDKANRPGGSAGLQPDKQAIRLLVLDIPGFGRAQRSKACRSVAPAPLLR